MVSLSTAMSVKKSDSPPRFGRRNRLNGKSWDKMSPRIIVRDGSVSMSTNWIFRNCERPTLDVEAKLTHPS
jgi:hypothetical protein